MPQYQPIIEQLKKHWPKETIEKFDRLPAAKKIQVLDNVAAKIGL